MNKLKEAYTDTELETIWSFLVDYQLENNLTKDDKITIRQIENDLSELIVGF